VVAVGSRAVTPAELLRDAVRRIRVAFASRHPALRVLRGAMAVGAGVLLLLRPELVLELLLLAAGGLLVFLGVGELAGMLEERPVRRRAAPPSPARVAVRLAALLGAVAAVSGAALAIALPTEEGEERTGVAKSVGCNGSREACDRRLNQVVFPATHNSFSAAELPGWLFANQRHGIERQLRDGIRAFLLDVHYGVRQPDGRVRTDLRAEGSSRNRVKRQLSLCHSLCELGAAPFVGQLRIISRFLERHRSEVIVLFVESYVPAAEIERALRAANLLDRVVELEREEPLPTLGELVATDRRLVVFTEAEEDAGARPWYLPGFSFVQDTPLRATKASELRCARSRGDPDSPLLLLNHWIDRFPPPVKANASIGRRSTLLGRAQRCSRERRLVPNLIAVDHYDAGDVVEVARTFNRRLFRRAPVQSPVAAAGRRAGSRR
jgi:hypothetical protein